MDSEGTTKLCRGCGEEKPLDEFQRRSPEREKFRSRCRACATKGSRRAPSRVNSKRVRSGVLCECGCGQFTFVREGGHGSRKPSRYLPGHYKMMVGRQSLANYEEVEAGYKTPCWLWRGVVNKDGYATSGKRLVHRTLYAEKHGAIPPNLECHHKCRNRSCVNPNHLEVTTHRGNIRQNSGVKLTAPKVREIRRRGKSASELAEKFGVSVSTIYSIWQGDSWAGV